MQIAWLSQPLLKLFAFFVSYAPLESGGFYLSRIILLHAGNKIQEFTKETNCTEVQLSTFFLKKKQILTVEGQVPQEIYSAFIHHSIWNAVFRFEALAGDWSAPSSWAAEYTPPTTSPIGFSQSGPLHTCPNCPGDRNNTTGDSPCTLYSGACWQ